MSELNSKIQRILSQPLNQEGLEFAEFIPISKNSNHLVVVRTVEEALHQFDHAQDENVQSYFIQVRKSKQKDVEVLEENIYLPDGKLNIPYLMRNAEILFVSQEWALSRKVYKTVLKSGEMTAEAFLGIGKCLEMEGHFEQAQAHFEESIAYKPTLEAYEKLSTLLIAGSRDLYAAEVLERALELHGLRSDQSFDLHKACGNCWIRAGQLDHAQTHYSKALSLNPKAYEIQTNLGYSLLSDGQLEVAEKCFRDALSAESNDDKAFYGLAQIKLQQGELKTALAYFVRSLEIKIDNPQAIFEMVKCAYATKVYQKAEELLARYIDVAPVNANLLFSLAGLQYHLGKKSEALGTAYRVLEMKPDHGGSQDLVRLIVQTQQSLSGRTDGKSGFQYL